MSKDVVWASNAMINPAMLRPITHSFGDDDQIDFAIEARRANDKGESLGPECFAPEIYVRKDANTNYEKLPHLFFAGSYWVVSGAVAEVMRRFDLGGGNLYSTKVFRKDRKTPIGDEWFCLNFGNVKEVLLDGGENTKPWIPEPPLRRSAPLILMDDRIKVSKDALLGSDIWVDPQITDLFFISNPLAKALKAAKLAGPFGLKRCTVT